jgi:hypothetical protein
VNNDQVIGAIQVAFWRMEGRDKWKEITK